MRKLTLTLVLLLTAVLGVKADWAFRNHRFDGFKPLDVNENSIVFLGNSITNMNEWRECFGNDPNILGRGNSGGFAYEWIDFFETVLEGNPKAIFYGLGTNDLAGNNRRTDEQICADISTFISRCLAESPNTEIFIQSIHPCNKGNIVATANAAIKEMINVTYGANPKVHFLDFQEEMKNVPTGGDYSYDRLHLTGKSVSIWAHAIAEKALIDGKPFLTCTLPVVTDLKQDNGGLGGSEGMRATHMSTLPVGANDIIFVGGEPVHGAEWHEYFANNNVKNRGTKWGAGDLTLADHKNQIVQSILGNHNGNQTAPAKILIYAGYNGNVGNSAEKTSFTNAYKELLTATDARLKELTPSNTTTIYAISMLSWNGRNDYAARNQCISDAVTAAKEAGVNVEYVDLTADMIPSGTMPAQYSIGGYPSGKGYAKMAQLLATKCGITPDEGRTAMTPELAADNIALYDARTLLVKAINDKNSYQLGTNIGQINEEGYNAIHALIDEANAVLQTKGASISDLEAKTAALNDFNVGDYMSGDYTPTVPTEDGWYTMVAVIGEPYSMGKQYVANTDEILQHTNGNRYLLKFDSYNEAKPAKYLVHITHDSNGNIAIQGVPGLYIGSNGVSSLAPQYYSADGGRPGTWYNFNVAYGNENPYIGGSTTNTSRLTFAYNKVDISDYKLYKVEIIDGVSAHGDVEPSHVFFNDPRNLGAAVAFDGGYFFVDKETVLTDQDIAMAFSASTYNGQYPVIHLDKEGGWGEGDGDDTEDNDNESNPIDFAQCDKIVVDYSSENQILDVADLKAGYYRLKMTRLQGSIKNETYIASGRNHVKSTDNYFHQYTNGNPTDNNYGMHFDVEDPDAPATEFLYIAPSTEANRWNIRLLTGGWSSTLCTVYLTPQQVRIAPVPGVSGKFYIGNSGGATTNQWNVFPNNGIYYLGGGSNTDNRWEITSVTEDELANYDVYVINIDQTVTRAAGEFHAKDMKGNVKVTLGNKNSDGTITPLGDNKGLQSVYDGGRFFVTKDASVSPNHFHVSNANLPAETAPEELIVTFGEKNEAGEIPVTIKIDVPQSEEELFNDPANKVSEMINKAGWYKIRAVTLKDDDPKTGIIASGTNWMLNTEDEYEQNLSGTLYYYPLKFAAANAELGATNHIYIKPYQDDPTENKYRFNINGLNGHIIRDNATSTTTGSTNYVPLAYFKNAEDENTDPNFIIGEYWHSFAPTDDKATESPYVGKYGKSQYNVNRFEIAQVTTTELALYDIYKVTIVGVNENASTIGHDTRVALNHARNKGIRKVFNGGYFFVDKADGTMLTAKDFTPDVIEGKTCTVVVGDPYVNEDDGLTYYPLTVTYGQAVTAISVTAPTEAQHIAVGETITVTGTLTGANEDVILATDPALLNVEGADAFSVGKFAINTEDNTWTVELTAESATPAAVQLTFKYGELSASPISVNVENSVVKGIINVATVTVNNITINRPYDFEEEIPYPTVSVYNSTASDAEPIDDNIEIIRCLNGFDITDNSETPSPVTIPTENPDKKIIIIVNIASDTEGAIRMNAENTKIITDRACRLTATATVVNPDGTVFNHIDHQVIVVNAANVDKVIVSGIETRTEGSDEVKYSSEASINIGEIITMAGTVEPAEADVDARLFSVDNSLAFTVADFYRDGANWSVNLTAVAPIEAAELKVKYGNDIISEQKVTVTVLPNATTVELTVEGLPADDSNSINIEDIFTPSMTTDAGEKNPNITTEVTVTAADENGGAAEKQPDDSYKATQAGDLVITATAVNPDGSKVIETKIITVLPNATEGIIKVNGGSSASVAVGDKFTVTVELDAENPNIPAPVITIGSEVEDAVTVETAEDGTVTYTAAKAGNVTIKATATNPNGDEIKIENYILSISYATPTTVSIDSESVPEGDVVLGDSFTLTAATDKENPAYEITYSFDPEDAVKVVTTTDEEGNKTTSFVALEAGEVEVTATATATDGEGNKTTLTSAPVTVTLVAPEPVKIPEDLEKLLEEITDDNKEEIAALVEELVEEINEALEEGAKVDIDVEDLKGHILMEIEIDAEKETKVALPNAATGDAAKELFYKSSNTEIAEVDQDGNITAKKAGRVFITMQIHLASEPAGHMLSPLDESAEPAESATEPTGKLLATHIYLVSVKENGKIESVEVPSSVSLTPGDDTTVDVTVNDGADATQIEWEAPEGVTVTPADDGTSLTIAAGDEDGEYTITGTYVDAFGKTQTIEIPVTVARKGSVVVGIDEINADINAGRREVYDLQGRRVVGVAKAGIYIIDGKKTFIR